ncbi:hypothetical protein CROQUDRAFT_562043 [Cronartium quercuum f. sp. fusiforme G11]|uniref:Transmembrane protein n=1 Tax=Cronartium quercuum f. sp. fusiforme G11 TaxID=708437 RepID=A0A9P6NGQ0_9BASI|nr:hypothetical protein CROQUDRAFT_562043 [Cronartium quercuum f. sp. fusiforme G11]
MSASFKRNSVHEGKGGWWSHQQVFFFYLFSYIVVVSMVACFPHVELVVCFHLRNFYDSCEDLVGYGLRKFIARFLSFVD